MSKSEAKAEDPYQVLSEKLFKKRQPEKKAKV